MVNILYEDNHIIVCVKERGILSQADGSDKPDMLNILKDYIKEKYNKPGNVYLGLVHRLDINTKGIMVFARTSKAANRLNECIKNNEFHKRYCATVEGEINNIEYIKLVNYLSKDEKNRVAYIDKLGKEAILEYRLLKKYKINNNIVSDIDIKLITGRFHQIRCQMANIGHPLYGDVKYGSKNHVSDEKFPLVAYHLEFIHPTTKELKIFEIEE
ncbi:MAG: RluA family pseudouridine synthase [Acholeplasmatales bacterium]|nr:RluA family pseudouridine synthase [Acholeplasmatales bacterium]